MGNSELVLLDQYLLVYWNEFTENSRVSNIVQKRFKVLTRDSSTFALPKTSNPPGEGFSGFLEFRPRTVGSI